MSDVTRILSRIEQGDLQAADQLLPMIYEELRRLAARQLASERTGHTLSPTALVHEAYLRLVGPDRQAEPNQTEASDAMPRPAYALSFNSRGHFFSAAAEAMRRILVDSARRKRALKRGGAAAQRLLDEANIRAPEADDELLALDEALTRLQAEHPPLADLVKLRYFAGLNMPQAAEALGISLRTAERNWTYAKAWLLEAMAKL